jgi:hypothetical protein
LSCLLQRIFASVLLLVCVGLALMAWPYQAAFSYEPVGPRAFPLLMLASDGRGVAVHGVSPGARSNTVMTSRHWTVETLTKIAICVVLLLVFAGTFEPLGFIVASILTGIPMARLYGGRWLPSVVIISLMAIGLYLLFDKCDGRSAASRPARAFWRTDMDTLGYLGQGFGVALSPYNLVTALCGTLIGTVVGLLPGLGPINGVALLIPIAFALGLPPESALILLAAVYLGCEYGGRISSILLNIPGEASTVMTTLDGYPMARKGLAGVALSLSAWSSFIGAFIATCGMVLFAPLLAKWAIAFGPAEYFVLMVFAISLPRRHGR